MLWAGLRAGPLDETASERGSPADIQGRADDIKGTCRMVIYFSGTGNSRFAAKRLAEQLQDTLWDAGDGIKRGAGAELESQRPWVFVSPTYGWRLPVIFSDYLRKAALSGSKDAYFVLTCGSEIGAAGAYAVQLCQEIGLTYRGILEVVMPENYIAMFQVPDEEESMRLVEAAKPVLDGAAAYIRQGLPFPEKRDSGAGRLKSGIVNVAFRKFFIKTSPFYAKSSCTGCGTCVSVCPLNDIHLAEDRTPVWGPHCTHCMACICSCPAEAIEYGRKSIGKRRYHCPD